MYRRLWDANRWLFSGNVTCVCQGAANRLSDDRLRFNSVSVLQNDKEALDVWHTHKQEDTLADTHIQYALNLINLMKP